MSKCAAQEHFNDGVLVGDLCIFTTKMYLLQQWLYSIYDRVDTSRALFDNLYFYTVGGSKNRWVTQLSVVMSWHK